MRKVLIALLGCCTLGAAAPGQPQSPDNGIGYASPAEALAALRAMPGVEISEKNGWTIVADRANTTIWSIASEGNPANPTAVKRRIFEDGGVIKVEMHMICNAPKAVCDNVAQSFQAANAEMARPFGQ